MKLYAEPLGREVTLRDGVSEDGWTFDDTFSGLYHVPPVEIHPETVLDLGANIGLVAAHYQQMWPEARIVCVEMVPESAALIAENCPAATVNVYAVSATGGYGTFDPALEFNRKRFIGAGLDSPNGGPVPSYTLRTICLANFAGPVDFVKMDLEGMEWPVLEQAQYWAPYVSSLLVELHYLDGDTETAEEFCQKAIDLLTPRGFEAIRHDIHPHAVWAWK